MNDLEARIKKGRKAITLARERGMDTALWQKELARLEALAQAEEVARRTDELIHSRGWCLWKCESFNGNTIVIVDDFAELEDLPTGYPVYIISEINTLFGDDKAPSHETLRLIHEAKKLGGAKVTGRVVTR
jgi:hypothetical protein